jgi:serine/threonine protein kinase
MGDSARMVAPRTGGMMSSPPPSREMTPERWTRLKELFATALDLSEPSRTEYLAKETADDPELAVEARSLLAAHEQPGEFLEPVTAQVRDAAFAAQEDTRIGQRVGAYRIVGALGSGGMGDVFKAVRDDAQYQAEVAIKLMRADVRNPLAEQRFKNERQILAALDHRNIARLLDGGTTQSGLPYVVMELVVGEAIDRYCDQKSLGIRDRVQLFLQVCAAASYAHQHLVVHRDLKPNNILVTADGSVKLLDFGIAKLLDTNPVASANTHETRTHFRLMTLEYASPEQVSGSPITTVSDVYSLGVVLYHLLTGQSPYRVRTNDAARVAEILSDTSPTRPSQVETRMRETIDADLDHILLMSLRKEPTKRYGSVEQFANDLRNYLSGLPVAARRGTLSYRLGKFARRNKVSIAATVLVAVSLVSGLGLALREARIANEQRAVAQRHFDSVRNLANTMLSDVYGEIDALPGAMNARAKLAQTAQRYLDELSKEANDAGLQADLANAYRKLGDIQGGVNLPGGGDSKSALDSYAKSVALLESVIAADPQDQRARIGLAKSLLLHSRVLLNTKGPGQVLTPTQRAVALAESAHEGYASDYERLQVVSATYFLLADVFAGLQRPEDAMPAYDKMIAVNEEYSAAHPDDIRGLKLLRNAYTNAAIAVDLRLSKEATFDRMIGMMRKSLTVSETLLAKEPDSPEHLTRLAEQRLNMGDGFYNVGNYQAALAMYRLAAPVLAKAATQDKGDARAQLALAMSDAGLAGSLAKTGDTAAAIPLFASAERSLTELLRKDPENMSTRFMLAHVEIFRGEMFVQLAGQSPSREARLEYWRKATASLDPGVARIKKINEQMPLAGAEKVVMDVGIAAQAGIATEMRRKR